MYWDHMNGWGWLMMVLWLLVWVGFLGVVAWAGLTWIRGGSAARPSASRPDDAARNLLDQRLASGEIDVDEYRRRRSALESGSGAAP